MKGQYMLKKDLIMKNQELSLTIANLKDQIKALEQVNKELREWKKANKPTGICETCTEKANQTLDAIRKIINT